jgi:hypothetical protein
MSTLSEKFSFKFADEPQYTHIATLRKHDQDYDIAWDADFTELHHVYWYDCSAEEIQAFIAEDMGWVILEDLDTK